MSKIIFTLLVLILSLNCHYYGGLTKEGTEIMYEAYVIKQNDFNRLIEIQKIIENNKDLLKENHELKNKLFSENEIKATKEMDLRIIIMLKKSLKIYKDDKNE